jgi:hypothetical protein
VRPRAERHRSRRVALGSASLVAVRHAGQPRLRRVELQTRVNAPPTNGFQKHELDCVFRPCANHGSPRWVLSKPDLSLLDEIIDGGAEAVPVDQSLRQRMRRTR